MKIQAALTALLLLLCTTSASADDLTMVPSIGYGISNLTFTRSTGEADDSRFNIIDLGMTASYGRYYMKFSTELPLGEEYTFGPQIVRQFKREDFGFTAGYYLRDNLSLFGGYAYGKTSIVTFDGGNGTPPYPVYTQHRDSGPFIGTNYSMFIGKTATLGLNVAYASMDGLLIVQDTFGGVSNTESGKTTGFSVGATWSDTYKDKLTYYFAYKRKNYKTDLITQSVDKTFDIFSFGFVFPI